VLFLVALWMGLTEALAREARADAITPHGSR
jgi:hypothetical protein